MAEAGISGAGGKADLNALLGLGSMRQQSQATADFSGISGFAPDVHEEVSVAGVMVLSAVSVCIAIMAAVVFALMLIAAWWLISHIPVPAVVTSLLKMLHLR